MKTRLILVAALCAATGSSVLGAGAEGQFVVRGLGAQSCSSLNDAMKGDNAQLVRDRLVDWISGWLSHANRSTEGVYDVHPVSDNKVVGELVRRICVSNPSALIDSVVLSSVNSVRSGRLTGVPELVLVEADGNQVQVPAELLKAVQGRLVELGFLEAKQADGKFGPATSKAISGFQESSKLAVNGLPDPITTYLIFLGK
ncbi:peptidoglycan-binding domain-containing protein [Pseudogemmobacter sp. W21_MBD1_M6]|uniref:peptidoglycan-binding domain-containing protein n=1 Tax=Pseudogemmobacter sp. W21_MBD1_M6 TaxID=3240271 RepID=UPI003F99B4A4